MCNLPLAKPPRCYSLLLMIDIGYQPFSIFFAFLLVFVLLLKLACLFHLKIIESSQRQRAYKLFNSEIERGHDLRISISVNVKYWRASKRAVD